MEFKREYLGKNTYKDYDNDKKEFFGHDARYEETTDIIDNSVPRNPDEDD